MALKGLVDQTKQESFLCFEYGLGKVENHRRISKSVLCTRWKEQKHFRQSVMMKIEKCTNLRDGLVTMFVAGMPLSQDAQLTLVTLPRQLGA